LNSEEVVSGGSESVHLDHLWDDIGVDATALVVAERLESDVPLGAQCIS